MVVFAFRVAYRRNEEKICLTEREKHTIFHHDVRVNLYTRSTCGGALLFFFMTLLLFVGLFVLAIVLGYIYFKRKLIPLDNGVPESKPQILFGNLWNSGLLAGKRTFHEIMHDYQRRFGDKFVFWFGSTPCVAFCLPKHAQAIFSDRHSFEQSPLFLPNFDLICPHSLVNIGGLKWKRHVRVMLPVFKRAKVIQHLDTMTDCADRFIDQCLAPDQVHTDLVQSCQTVTMNIFGLIAFDYDLDSQVNSKSRTVFRDFISYVVFLIMMAWLPRWLNKLYLKVNWNYQHTNRFLRQLMTKIVEQEENNQAGKENDDRPKNLIASLVSSLNEQATDEQMTSGLTRVEMFDEVLLSLVAGFETTSTALAWCIFYMSKNAQVQRRMKDELRENDLLITDDVQYLPPLTKEKLDALVYCDCVTKEVRVILSVVRNSLFTYRHYGWLPYLV